MIRSITIRDIDGDEYPFNIPSIQNTDFIEVSDKVTILVGDNGSGKSTLLQAIAYYNNSINVSSESLDSEYYEDVAKLSKKIKINYNVKTRKGFFFSGEEFITYIHNLKKMKLGLLKDIAEIEEEFKGKSDYSKQLALGPLKGQLYELEDKYSGELRTKSHGEGFLTFFKSRMHQQGIYLLDEPETPLSATNQYQLLVLIHDLVREGSQVIIATHSPILMSIKGARIYDFTSDGIKQIEYDDIESVFFTKHFLNNKDNYLDKL